MLTLIRDRARQLVKAQRQRLALRRVARATCSAAPLAKEVDGQRLRNIFASPEIAREWRSAERTIADLGIADKALGVNPGDRRALYYLVRAFRTRTLLEIGTHIGASTVHAAAALRANRSEEGGDSYRMTSVDLIDVNDPRSAPWVRYGSRLSPRGLVTAVGAGDHVTFVIAPALQYLRSCDDRYDFVFLDGDHSATAVYQEIVAALRVLNQGGVVLLHDYFPRLRPLWSNDSVISGPWLGAQRLKAEGAGIDILPLGELPWETKLSSSVTSLALLVGTK